MEKQECGRFHAISFNDKDLEFIVFSDNTIDCPALGKSGFNWIDLKPRFVLHGNGGSYTYNVNGKERNKNPKELIRNFAISEELFFHLQDNHMVKFSNDMAYFYDLPSKKGFDSRPGYYGVGSPYKWAKKKGPILVKQREGHFN